MTVSPIKLEINHVEIVGTPGSGGGMEWGADFEEILGGTGRASFVVKDFAYTWNPQPHWDVKASIRSSGWILFRGEIIKPKGILSPAANFVEWKFDCAGYFDEFSQRLVGALDGVKWIDADGTGDYVNIDEFATTLGDDRSTVISWLDHYIRVDGTAIGTSLYVGQYVTVDPPIYPEYTNLLAALEELASEAPVNLQFWLDPDLEFHWWSVPAWQDLAQEAVSNDLNGADPGVNMMFPEANLGSGAAGYAPKNISDVSGTPGAIGCRNFAFDYDGTSMPEQVYVKGGTGYVYNNGVDQFATTTAPSPGPTFPGQYQITFNTDTLVYSRETGTGYIHLPGVTIPAGTVVYANPQKIPLDPVHLTGGSFYNMKTGPMVGYLVSFWSNSLGYGDITVELAGGLDFCNPPAVPPAPILGIGGSGWTNETPQDPTKRQAYFDAPVSVTQAQRDAIGGQIEYRGSRPTLRGSCTVGGYIEDPLNPEQRILAEGDDGWRVGQLIKITDTRLPPTLNNRYYVIQRVHAKPIPTTDAREYDLDWGDGPVSRWSARARERTETPPPTIGVLVTEEDVAPAPNAAQKITGQLINAAGLPWAIPDKIVNWYLQVLDSAGNVCDQGTLDPATSTTDRNGTARTKLTAGPGRGLTYYVYATVPVV